MEIVLLLLLGIGIAVGLKRILSKGEEKSAEEDHGKSLCEPPNQLPVLVLQEEDGLFVEYEGVRYLSPSAEAGLCPWHGRMGEGIGLLQDQRTRAIAGELYHLREDRQNILLAHLPQEGYPITDMLLLIREETDLPPITPNAFAYGEVYRVLGEVPEEDLELLGEITDQALLSSLVTAWTDGPETVLPQGNYQRYRIRLHSKHRQGLYVSISLNVCETENCFAVEKRGFEGDTLVSPRQGLSITKV